ncbi:MAG: hypothetical protein V2A73_00150, partial [Pseudomonadota bacterium]
MTKETASSAKTTKTRTATKATKSTRTTKPTQRTAFDVGFLAVLVTLVALVFMPARPASKAHPETMAGSISVPLPATSPGTDGIADRPGGRPASDRSDLPLGGTEATVTATSANLSAAQREKTVRAIDSIAPPISAAPASTPDLAGSFVLRDRDVSAFFVKSGLALALIPPGTSNEPGLGDGEFAATRAQAGTKTGTETRPDAGSGSSGSGWGLHWNLADARPVAPQPEGELPGRVSSFVGPERQWRTGMPTYARVAYAELYPGIDLALESRRCGVEYRFVVKPGAKVDALRMRYRRALERSKTLGSSPMPVTLGASTVGGGQLFG